MSRPGTNLARFGVTLIPPESLEHMMNVIRTKTRDDFMPDALEVLSVMETARQQNKFVILYDV
jgi:hypothetical protein